MIKRNKIVTLLVLPVLTGILLAISAIPSKIWYVGFVAFIPLLTAADRAVSYRRPLLVFSLQLLITLLTFYLGMGFWVLKTANPGFLIGLFLLLPFILLVSPYILFRRRGSSYASLYFIAAWLGAEFIQGYFPLGSPFFNLGHNPGSNPQLIQWYEYTGAAGGTLWIMCVNFLLFSFLKSLLNGRQQIVRKGIVSALVIVLPAVISLVIYHNYKEKGPVSEVVIVHPSTDNRDVKYRVNIYELTDIYLKILLPHLTDKTEYVVLPETAITNAGWVGDFNNNLVFNHLNESTAQYPDLKWVTGAIVYDSIPDVEKIKHYKRKPGIRFSEKYNAWYHTYNAALFIEKSRPVQMRVKDGLVPYQEYAPFPQFLPRISPVGIDFQFSKREKNRKVFVASDRVQTAALICYELVFGKLFSETVRDGAQAFFVLLNEGWYNNVRVSRQFLQLSVIRAIENRRSVAHSSNMGISAFINQKGDVISRMESRAPGCLKAEIRMNKKASISTMAGNYLGVSALITIATLAVFELLRKNIKR